MQWIVFFTIEILGLTYLGALISALASSKIITSPDKNILTATCYSLLLPCCLCSAYPIVLFSRKAFLRIYIAVLTPMLSPQIILLSLRFISLKYLILRILLSILIALIVAQISLKLKLIRNVSPALVFFNKEKPERISAKDIFYNSYSLFSQSLKPILTAITIGTIIKIILSVNYVAKYILFPSRRILAILLAALLKFCGGQEVIILYSLKNFHLNIGFSLAFSIMATGFCISLIPVYLRIYKPAGLITLVAVLTTTALLIAPLSF